MLEVRCVRGLRGVRGMRCTIICLHGAPVWVPYRFPPNYREDVMSWTRMLLLANVGQQFDIKDIQHGVERMRLRIDAQAVDASPKN